jgi:peptidyl-tRNA hydrolase
VKMYILVRDSLALGNAVVAVAHASLACYLKYRETPEVAEWLGGPFRKVVCKVTDEEFARAKETADHVVLTESSLGGAEVALAFKPRAVWDKSFQYFRLYR